MKTLQRGMAAMLLAVLLTLAGCGAPSLPRADGAANEGSGGAFSADGGFTEGAAANGGMVGTAHADEGFGDVPVSGGAAASGSAFGEAVSVDGASGEVSGGTVCTLSISCAAVLAHWDALGEKAELVPADGVLRAASAVEFTEGESVFELLRRVCRAEKIHMEFSEAPLYGSAYIEGIGNLYEFDCGEGSGWMYRVNGTFPRVGCAQYTLQAGDVVEWVYTCDFGADVGSGEVSG